MDRKIGLAVFYTLLVPFLLAGFVLSFVGAEAYPSIVFPGFREVGTTEGLLQFERPDIRVYANGNMTRLEPAQILKNIPAVNHPTIMLQRFRYPNGVGGKEVNGRLGGMNMLIKASPVVYPESVLLEWYDHLEGVVEEETGSPADSMVVVWEQYSGYAGEWNILPMAEKVVIPFQNSHP